MNEDRNITSVARIERMINRLKKDNPLINDWEDYMVSFEYICASLFPECYKNIQREINNQYTKGYIQGIEDSKNEN